MNAGTEQFAVVKAPTYERSKEALASTLLTEYRWLHG